MKRLLRAHGLLLGSGLLALLLFVALAWWLQGLQPSALVLQLAFDARRFGAVVHQWSAEDLARYRAHLPWDFVLLASYAAFGALLARRTAVFDTLSRRVRAVAAAALPLAALFDAAENGWHLWLTAAPRFDVRWAYPLAASCAALKWVLVIAWALLLAWALWRGARAERS